MIDKSKYWATYDGEQIAGKKICECGSTEFTIHKYPVDCPSDRFCAKCGKKDEYFYDYY